MGKYSLNNRRGRRGRHRRKQSKRNLCFSFFFKEPFILLPEIHNRYSLHNRLNNSEDKETWLQNKNERNPANSRKGVCHWSNKRQDKQNPLLGNEIFTCQNQINQFRSPYHKYHLTNNQITKNWEKENEENHYGKTSVQITRSKPSMGYWDPKVWSSSRSPEQSRRHWWNSQHSVKKRKPFSAEACNVLWLAVASKRNGPLFALWDQYHLPQHSRVGGDAVL